MKKVLYAIAAVALTVFAASCAREVADVQQNGDLVEVSFNVAMPNTVATKAISDGETAKKLEFRVYDAAGKHLTNLDQTVDVNGKQATVNVKLVGGLEYQFVFWAQKAGQYTIAEDGTITLNPAGMMNSDDWDAFYAQKTMEVTTAFNESITLTRPFAQINVGAVDGDLQVASDCGIDLTTLTSKYIVSKVNTKLNLLDGTVSTPEENVEITAADYPAAKIKVGETDYDHVAMLYVLAGDKETVNVDLKLQFKQNGVDKEITRTVPNTPIQRNYRTNILGNIFTVGGVFTITVDNDFKDVDEYNNDYVPEYATIADLNAAFAAGKAIGYNVAVTTSADGTIVLPKTADEVRIFLRGDFSNNTINIEYAEGATASEKPANLYITAPKLKELKGDLAATHVEIVTSSNIETGELTTSNGTLVIQPNAYMGILTVKGGSLRVEGKLDNGTVEATAVGANTVVTHTGEVGTLTIKTGEVLVEGKDAEGNAGTVDKLIIDNSDDTVGDVIIESDAIVNSITGDTDTVKDEDGEELCFVSNLDELNEALAGDVDVIYFNGDPITSVLTISREVTINGLQAGSATSIDSELISVKAQNVILNSLSVKTEANKARRIINVYPGASLTLNDADIVAPPAGNSETRIIRSENNTTVIIKNSSLVGYNSSTKDDLQLEIEKPYYRGAGNQGLGIGGDLILENTSLSGFYYAIRTWSGNNASEYTQNVKVKDSYIDGWSALYLVDDGTTCTVEGSTILGRNYISGDSNAFGVIYMQPLGNTPGTLTLTNTTIYNVPKENVEYPVIVTSGSTVNLNGEIVFVDPIKGEYSCKGMISVGVGENDSYTSPVDGFITLNNNADVTIDGVEGAKLLYDNIITLGENDVMVSYSDSNTGYQNAANLRSAINSASDGATVYIPEGTYKFTTSDGDRIFINKDKKITSLTLVGLGSGAVFEHEGDRWGKSRCFYIYTSLGSSNADTHLTMKNIKMSLANPETNTDFVLYVRGLSGIQATNFVLDLYNVECDRAIIDNGNYVAENKVTFNLYSSTINHLTVDAAPFGTFTDNTYSYVTCDEDSKMGVYFQDSIKEEGLANIRINGVAPTSKDPILINM